MNMTTDVDVRVERLGKQYRAGTRRGASRFLALDDVSFEVKRGEALGIIGRNGAGKSTLLKILAGITAPTHGRVVIHGHLSALIEVGSGFHPELTGRENVFLSGAILGMDQRDIARKLPSIFEFAGVGAFIDTPIKWYSSGMYVRLGFSVAAHLEPEILLIDEVLAVGDAEFQARCLQRVHELKSRGVTIILISHDLTAVEQLCDSAVLLEKGRIAAQGAVASVIAAYHRSLTTTTTQAAEYSEMARDGVVKLTGLSLSAESGSAVARTGERLVARLRYEATRTLAVLFELCYYSGDGKTLIASTATPTGEDAIVVEPNGGEVEFSCAVLPLARGSYYVGAVVKDARSGHAVAWWDGGTMLHVGGGDDVRGQMFIPHEWRVHVSHRRARVG